MLEGFYCVLTFLASQTKKAGSVADISCRTWPRIIAGVLVFACAVCLAGCLKQPTGVSSPSILSPGAQTSALETKKSFGYIRLSAQQKDAMLARLSMQRQKLTSWKDLRPSLERSLAYLRSRPAKHFAVQADGLTCTWGDLEATVRELIALLPDLDANPGYLKNDFDWYMLDRPALMTGYYEPLIHVSPAPCPEYPFPIYGLPNDLKVADLGKFRSRWKGQKLIYCIKDGKICPYHTRKEIDTDRVLEDQGVEIAWARDLVDIFFLQIQGSGLLAFPDGTVRHVLYAGKNGRKYVSLGQVLVRKGYMSADRMSMQGIRAFLKNRPELVKDLLNTNPSYVFFRLAHDGPYGAMGEPLTPLLSVASDPSRIPLGAVLLQSVHLPSMHQEDTAPVVMLGLAQDRGGAIQGDHLDLFCGKGGPAAFLAGHMQEQARVCILVRLRDEARK